ncbi:ELL-associated factor 1-like [Homarus americanus]|uniref:Ell-associated factor Eaf n=1 Tax=Homarus americanus TaxID=6706 RepID=A0A8J5JXH7_HOMAM|nr:ELL-associated factor 1-like [Homarus americanus]KAG7165672.1 Ell-associated factor Eaf-like [Homarus americanus]
MADKLGLDGEEKEMKLGDTFNKGYKDAAYHTIRYDFKPASVDKQKMGTVEVEGNHQVSVTVPHVEGSGTSQTVFKGNHKQVAKECILIIDHVTGEIVLERISQTISVKTTRPEGSSRIPTQRPTTPLDPSSRKNSPPQKCSPSHLPSRGSANSLSRPSPSHVKYSPPPKSSPHARSPFPNKSPNSNHCTAPGSMPMLGFDDADPVEKGEMSDSSSESDSNSSSSSCSDSDSDSEPEQETVAKKANGHGTMVNGTNDLIEDLQLSSASEDSD